MPRVRRDRLTPKQSRFIREFLVDLNATQAAIRAGYSRKSARVTGAETLTKPAVEKAIAAARAKVEAKLECTADDIAREMHRLGFANMLDYMQPGADGDPHLDFSKLTRDQAAALTEVTVEDFKDGRGEEQRDVRRVKFKLADKRAALVDLSKLLGYMRERHEHTGKDGGPIVTETWDLTKLTEDEFDALKQLRARAGAPATNGHDPAGLPTANGRGDRA